MFTSQVILAGAGPGDKDLITVKLANALAWAEVILVDRLVNHEIIHQYANASTEVISVGKEGNSAHSFTQEEINQLLLKYASENKRVLRLKGGDVAIYSNVVDEIKTLLNQNISFEIIPGITAASGIAASLKIPLTGREYASGVQIHSLSTNDIVSGKQLSEWADTNDTLVFYMSTAGLIRLAENLLHHGAHDKYIAIIEQGTTPQQINSLTTLSKVRHLASNREFQSPTLIIIGDILSLMPSESLKPSAQSKPFFTSLNSQN